MPQLRPLMYFCVVVYLAILISVVQSFTDPLDVIALLSLYSTLNYSSELKGWRTNGGDPCDGTWTGVFCVGSSVINLKLNRRNLSGNLGDQFYLLHNLKKLNLSHNDLSGSIGNVFSGLQNLVEMYGFSPVILFPLNWKSPLTQKNSSHPSTELIIIEKCPYKQKVGKKGEKLGPGEITIVAGGGGLLIIFAALFIAICKTQICAKQSSMTHINVSLPVSTVEGYSTAPDDSLHFLPLSSPVIDGGPNHARLTRHDRSKRAYGRRSFSKGSRFPVRTKSYTVAELESATNKYGEENHLGEGSLGSVYKAEFPDGQILAVKRVELAALSFTKEQQFLDVVCTVSRLRHPNIVSLLGYSVENGQHLLAYEYVRNLSLDDALHSVTHEPLSWSVRIQIAHEVAKALDYLHNAFFPPFAHCNLKAANIMLDEELMPRICDCGLSVLKPLASNRVKIQAAQIAIADTGYFAPEYGQLGIDYTKSDVFAFGVLLLELITGRKPNDLRPGIEQSLSRWASFQLHDCGNLDEIIDPYIKGTLSSKVLSRCADIISLCIQPVMERRPPMFAVVGYLTSIQRRVEMEKRAEGKEVDTFEKSFHTTNSGFISSPTYSCSSI